MAWDWVDKAREKNDSLWSGMGLEGERRYQAGEGLMGLAIGLLSQKPRENIGHSLARGMELGTRKYRDAGEEYRRKNLESYMYKRADDPELSEGERDIYRIMATAPESVQAQVLPHLVTPSQESRQDVIEREGLANRTSRESIHANEMINRTNIATELDTGRTRRNTDSIGGAETIASRSDKTQRDLHGNQVISDEKIVADNNTAMAERLSAELTNRMDINNNNIISTQQNYIEQFNHEMELSGMKIDSVEGIEARRIAFATYELADTLANNLDVTRMRTEATSSDVNERLRVQAEMHGLSLESEATQQALRLAHAKVINSQDWQERGWSQDKAIKADEHRYQYENKEQASREGRRMHHELFIQGNAADARSSLLDQEQRGQAMAQSSGYTHAVQQNIREQEQYKENAHSAFNRQKELRQMDAETRAAELNQMALNRQEALTFEHGLGMSRAQIEEAQFRHAAGQQQHFNNLEAMYLENELPMSKANWEMHSAQMTLADRAAYHRERAAHAKRIGGEQQKRFERAARIEDAKIVNDFKEAARSKRPEVWQRARASLISMADAGVGPARHALGLGLSGTGLPSNLQQELDNYMEINPSERLRDRAIRGAMNAPSSPQSTVGVPASG